MSAHERSCHVQTITADHAFGWSALPDDFRSATLTAEIAEGKSLSLQAAQSAVGHAGRGMAGLPDAPILILTAEGAMTPSVTMAVRTAAAQRQSGRDHGRQGGGKNDNSEQGSRKFLHEYLHFSPS